MTSQQYWSYWTEPQLRGVELASWQGDRLPDTRTHFHDEDQITLVLSGSRIFLIADTEIEVSEGRCVVIPAGVPHRGLSRSAPGTHCVNLYFEVASPPENPFIFSVKEYGDFRAALDTVKLHDRLASQIDGRPILAGNYTPVPANRIAVGGAPIAEIAKAHGSSREGFSRNFRRTVGMPPHAFRLMKRLNVARQQFRSGHALAEVAAELGFSDQSHLGRHFRRVFGITPGGFVRGVRRSQTFQT